MTSLEQAALIGGAIFFIVMKTQFGRHEWKLSDLKRPLISGAVFGFIYLKAAPTGTTGEIVAYAVAVGLALLTGGLATLFTKVDRDANTGKLFTTAGYSFAAVWFTALIARVVFVWAATDNAWFHLQVGKFMMEHSIQESAIAPFFVIWAVGAVLVRTGLMLARTEKMNATTSARGQLQAA